MWEIDPSEGLDEPPPAEAAARSFIAADETTSATPRQARCSGHPLSITSRKPSSRQSPVRAPKLSICAPSYLENADQPLCLAGSDVPFYGATPLRFDHPALSPASTRLFHGIGPHSMLAYD